MANTSQEIMKFFTHPELGRSGPTVAEFREFWETLSDEEKAYYKNADLSG